MTSGERILRILNAEPDVVEAENPLTLSSVKGHITFENVCFGYNGDDLKVKNFSLDIAPGRKVALVGPSGSGKSTIASLLLRFYDVSSGSIKVDGTDIRRLSISGYRGNIGVVLQESFLFSGTIEENIRYGRSDAPFEDVVKAAKMANAHDFISELPRGYQTEIGENGAMVSGGQKQRIAIARAVLRDPKILILDEATSALDTVSERTVQDALDKLMEGRTTIIVAHRLTTVQNADTIVVMRGGVIEQTGGHSKLMLEPGLYRELYSMQKRGSGKDGGSSGSGAVSNAA
jgi:subfamily B ATP-binding cassette protein MsbA